VEESLRPLVQELVNLGEKALEGEFSLNGLGFNFAKAMS